MSETINNTSFNNVVVRATAVWAFVIYLLPMLVGCYIGGDDPTSGAINGISLFAWVVFAIQAVTAMARDDMVMGRRPVVLTGPAIIVNFAMCIMTVVAQDQHDVAYALIGIVIGIIAIAVMAMKRK